MSGFMPPHFPTEPFQTSHGFPVMLVSLKISMLILFPKLELSRILRWFLSFSPANAKNRYTQNHKWRRRISTFPQVSTVPFLQFPARNWSSHVSYPLSSPHSLPWSKPLTIVASQSYRKLFQQRLWTSSTKP